MSRTSLDAVRAAYAARSADYIALLGRIEDAAPSDRDFVLSWASGLRGPVLDVGCGPGQWTHFLSTARVDTEGLDPVPEFVDSARANYPSNRYRVGRAEYLGVADGALAGVLAWYSLIHTEPAHIDAPLAEFARCIAPGGGLAIGFCTGPRLEPFDHAVVTAYYWPIDLLASKVEDAGFTVTRTVSRADPGARAHGALLATRG